MKKAYLYAVAALAVIVMFAWCGTAWAGYTTTNLSNNALFDQYAQINSAGHVVWYGYDGYDFEIFLYDGVTTTQFTTNGDQIYHERMPWSIYNDDYFPQINDAGQIAWHGDDLSDNEIFLYDGVSTTKLTNNAYNDYNPLINASGQVVWHGYEGTDYEIFLYDGATTTQLTSNGLNDINPQINGAGQVVWKGYDGTDYEIFLYEGATTTKLTNNAYNDANPQINDAGLVTWHGYDGTDYEIFLYDGTTTTQLTNNAYDDANPQVNDSGLVTWHGYDGTDNEIFLYDGATTTQLTNNAYNDANPQINVTGQVVWHGHDGTDYEVFLYDGATTTQLTNNAYYDANPQINVTGQVVWNGSVGPYANSEIFLASPCAEGRLDLSLSKDNVLWASYADYLARMLTIDMTIHNNGFETAYNVNVTGTSNTDGVITRSMAGGVGGFAVSGRTASCPACPGGSAGITMVVEVPSVVSSFFQTVHATAQDACGTTYTYP